MGDEAVTVVIPVWDRYVRLLPAAVASVRANDPSAPIIVVDNSSEEALPQLTSCEIVRTPERLSVGAARNLGLGQVGTEYTLVLDADDTLLPGALDLMSRRLAADHGLSACAMGILEAETGERHRAPRRFVRRLVRFPRLFAFANCVWSFVPVQGCALFRTELLRDAGGYADSDWGDDWVVATSMAFRGRFEVHQQLGRRYSATPSSISRLPRSNADLMNSTRLVRERVREDSATPGWIRAALPIIAFLQFMVVHAARPSYLFLQSLRARK